MITNETFNDWVKKHQEKIPEHVRSKVQPLFTCGYFNIVNWNGGDPLRDFATYIHSKDLECPLVDTLLSESFAISDKSTDTLEAITYRLKDGTTISILEFDLMMGGKSTPYIGCVYHFEDVSLAFSWETKNGNTETIALIPNDIPVKSILKLLVEGRTQYAYGYVTQAKYLDAMNKLNLNIENFR